MKKIVSLILLVAMLVTSVLATSCGGDNGGDNFVDTVNYDIDLSKKPTLKVLMPNSGKSIEEVNSDNTALLIEELTGYKTQYTQLPADATTTLNNTIMDKVPYDVMKLTKDQFSDLVKQDALLDITEALKVFGPDLLANISDESWDVVTVDGRIYGIPERASSDNIENPIVLNYDLMLELNLDVPETLDEFTEVLKAMTEHLGKPALTFDKFTPLVYAISAAFGIYSYWQEYDGEVLFYMNAPRYNEYVEYMHSLYAAGYIDQEVATNTAADATTRFTNSFKANSGNVAKSGAYACSIWTVSAIVSNLNLQGVDTSGELDTHLAYVRSLKENAGDAEKVYRSSGYTYITAIPYYSNETAGYALDWMNSKIKDTATEDNFRKIVIGEENVHWTLTAAGEYMPINPAFEEKNDASYYMTGSNENKYTQYWLARVRKQPELFRAWSIMMEDADKVGVYNVVDFTPPIEDYNSNRANIETNAQDWFYIMLKDGSGKLNEYITKLNGQYKCEKATQAINDWYQSK